MSSEPPDSEKLLSDASEPDAIWDAWIAARREEPALTPEAFAARQPGGPEAVREALATLIALEGELGPSPLIDVALGAAPGVFAGFRIERRLGQGGSGIVFLAADERAERPTRGQAVALKVLNPLLSTTPERRESILREAEVGRRLEHPGIVPVLDAGIERGYAWISTQYVDGRSLSEAIDEGLSFEETLRIGIGVADALAHAHEHGVVHRDLKPGNVMLDREGRPHVLDFGLAQADGTAFAVTVTGEIVGTLMYMAPEQIDSQRDVGPATDLHALGLILLDCLTGREPLPEGEVMRQLGDAAKGRRRAGGRLRQLPPHLRSVVMRCLERHPADRYSSAELLREDLERVLEGEPPQLVALSVPARLLRRVKRHPVRAAAAVIGSVALVVGALGVYSTWPVPVTIDSFRRAKRITVDGEELGLTPVRARLRPGRHEYRLVRGLGPEGYDGSFEVARGRRAVFLPHDPPDGTPALEEVPWSAGRAWVQIGTPHPEMQLVLDGRDLGIVPGLSMAALLPGRHTVRIEVPGMRPVERDFELGSTELHTLLVEPDPVDSPWHTVTLYNPLDVQVQASVVELRRLRLYIEDREIIDVRDRREVHKLYWAPTVAYEDSWVLMRVELPVEPEKFVIVWNRFMAVTGTEGDEREPWTRLEMGPSPEELVRLRTEPYDGAQHEPGRWQAEFVEDDLEELARCVRGRTTLFVRMFAGNAPYSEASAYATILRSNGLPMPALSAEKSVWIPALTIRVRKKE